MKLTDKMRWGLCILAAFILMGVSFILYITGVPYNPKIMRTLEFAMFMVVMYLLIIYPRMLRSKMEDSTQEDSSKEKISKQD